MGLFDMFRGEGRGERKGTDVGSTPGLPSGISSEALHKLASEQFFKVLEKISPLLDVDISKFKLPSIQIVSDAKVSALLESGTLATIRARMPDTGYVAPGPWPLKLTDDLSWYCCSEKRIFLAQSHLANGYVYGELAARWIRDIIMPNVTAPNVPPLERQKLVTIQSFLGYMGRKFAEETCRETMPELFGPEAQRYAPISSPLGRRQ